MSNQDREQALLKAGAQLNGLDWPRIEDEDGTLIPVHIGVDLASGPRQYWGKSLSQMLREMEEDRGIPVTLRGRDEWSWRAYVPDPLAAMCNHVDAPGLTERLPELGTVVPKTAAVEAETSTALPTPAGVFAMASTTHKLGGWGA